MVRIILRLLRKCLALALTVVNILFYATTGIPAEKADTAKPLTLLASQGILSTDTVNTQTGETDGEDIYDIDIENTDTALSDEINDLVIGDTDYSDDYDYDYDYDYDSTTDSSWSVNVPNPDYADRTVTVTSYKDLRKAINSGTSYLGKTIVTLGANIVTTKYDNLDICYNIELVIPEEYTLTIDCGYLYIYGALTSGNSNIHYDYYANLMLSPGGVWNRNNVQYTAKSLEKDSRRNYYVFSLSANSPHLEAYNESPIDLYITAPETCSVNSLNIRISALARTRTYFNGQYYIWDGYNNAHAAEDTPRTAAPWTTSKSCSVDNSDDLALALDYYKTGGTITLTSDATLAEHGMCNVYNVSQGVTLIINPGVTLTVLTCFDIYGTLISEPGGISFGNHEGWMWVNAEGKWNRGDVVFAVDSKDGRHAAARNSHSYSYGDAFRFDIDSRGLTICGGWYCNLRITDPSNTFALYPAGIYEGAKIYVNDQIIYDNNSEYMRVDDPSGLGLAWHCAFNNGTGIIIAKDMTIDAGNLCSYEGLGTIIASDVTVTLTNSQYVGAIRGTLTCDEGAIQTGPEVALMLANNAVWHYGDMTFSVKTVPGFESDNSNDAFIFDISDDIWYVHSHGHVNLYIILPAYRTFDDLDICFDPATVDCIYVNGVLTATQNEAVISQPVYVPDDSTLIAPVDTPAGKPVSTARSWSAYNESNYFYSHLSADEKTVYDRITQYLDGWLYTSNDYTLDTTEQGLLIYTFDFSDIDSINIDQINKVVSQYDLSKYFFAADISCCPDCGAVDLLLYPMFADGAARQAAADTLNQKIVSWIDEICQNCDTEFEMVKYLHDKICEATTYDYDLVDEGVLVNKQGHSIYSVLNGLPAICTGYSRTFNLIANALGIECLAVTGNAHAWNLVKVNGTWYNLDCTWDDSDSEEAGTQMYNFLLFSDSYRPAYYPGYLSGQYPIRINILPECDYNYR